MGEGFCYIHQAELRPHDDDNDDFFVAIIVEFCYHR